MKILSELQANVFELHLPLMESTCLKRGLDPGAVRGRRRGWRCQHAEEEEEEDEDKRSGFGHARQLTHGGATLNAAARSGGGTWRLVGGAKTRVSEGGGADGERLLSP